MTLQQQFADLERHLERLVVGQAQLLNRMLVTLLCDGHLLVEGAPGLAKTRAIKVLSRSIEGDFHRLQFTPDLLPADLTGTEIYRPEDGSFVFHRGPLFHNLVLADEVNRAPAKVQSALLEAMGERQITVGSETYPLPALFMVMATQNPIEQEGTYPLPEAQLDRFLLHVLVDYPDAAGERAILALNRERGAPSVGDEALFEPAAPLAQQRDSDARGSRCSICTWPSRSRSIWSRSCSRRARPERYGEDLAGTLQYGASPRATHRARPLRRARTPGSPGATT